MLFRLIFAPAVAPALLAVALSLPTQASASPPVEVTDPVGLFLRRLEEKGVLRDARAGIWPRGEAEVAALLAEANARRAELSAWDRRRLDHHLTRFAPERKKTSRLHYADGSPFTVHGSVEYYTGVFLRDSLPRPDHHGFGSFTPGVQVTYSDFAWATVSGSVGSERHWLDRFTAAYQYDPSMGLPYNVNRDGRTGSRLDVSNFDAARVVLGLGSPHLRVEIGQDWNQWGPGRRQQLTLGPRPHFWIADAPGPGAPSTGFDGTSDPGAHRRGYRTPGEGPPLPQVRLRFGSGRWEYTKVIAARRGLWKDSLATLVAHRLQVRLGDVRLGASEMTAIGTRTPDAVYFLPGMPQRVAEHEASDRDNAAMSVDAEWVSRGPWFAGRVYGEFFLDDYSGPPLDFWGNKFAWTLGGSWQDPLGLPAELWLEYAHVDPWVYGHHLSNTQMQSFGALLGSGLPPNSRSVRGALEFPLPGGLDGRLEGHWQQRDLESAGSSLFDGKPQFAGATDADPKAFLAGTVETRGNVEAGVAWRWRRFAELELGLGWLGARNFRGDRGATLRTATARTEVRVRY